MSDLPFLVAGGGIGGLATALALAGCGRPTRLFEQAHAFEEVGAGLQMSPNGVRALQELGAWDAVSPSCVIPSEIHMRDGRSGAVLQRIRLGKTFEDRFGAPYRVGHRADLLAGLLAVARSTPGIELNTGCTAAAVTQSHSGVSLSLAGGAVAEGEALVAADGIRSALRATVCVAVAPAARNAILYRGLIPLQKVPPDIEADCVTLWLCPGGHVVHYPVSNWRNFNIVAAVDGSLPDAGWQTPANSAEVLRRFSGICEELASLLGTPPSWARWPGADVPSLPRWSKGRVALLGDAAHATLPFLAQGAMMALEDAVVLVRETARAGDPAVAFRNYEHLRRPRTALVQERSRAMARIYHASGPLAAARNLTFSLAGPGFALRRLEWIYRWVPENRD